MSVTGKKISALDPGSLPLTGTEIIPIIQGGANKKVTAQDISNLGPSEILGAITFDASAPTPGKSGKYSFTTGGTCSWLTGGAATVAVGDEVVVVYTAPSTYTYTKIGRPDIEQVRSQSTSKVPSSKLVDDELNLKFDKSAGIDLTKEVRYYDSISIPVDILQNHIIWEGGSISEFEGYKIKIYPVMPGSLIRIKGSVGGSGISYYGFYAENTLTTLITAKSKSTSEFDEYIIVPTGANYIGVVNSLGLTLDMYDYADIQQRFTEINVRADKITELINSNDSLIFSYNQLLNETSTIIGHYLSHTPGAVVENAAYSVKVYHITNFGNLKLDSYLGGNNIARYILFADSELTQIIEIGDVYNSGDEINFKKIISITQECYLAVTCYQYVSESQIYDKLQTNISDSLSKVVEIAGDGIYEKLDTTNNVIAENYIHSSGVLASNASYHVNVYDLSGKQTIKVRSHLGGDHIARWAFFADSACTSLIALGAIFYSGNPSDYEEIVNIPVGANYIGVTSYMWSDESVVLLLDKSLTEHIEKIETSLNAKLIKATGDSLTSSGLYLAKLLSLLNADGSKYTGYNGGVGGEGTKEIMARQGGAFAYLATDITLPATTTPIQIGNYSDSGLRSIWDNNGINLLRQGGNGVNPVSIDGVLCTLAWTGNAYNDPDGTYTLTRLLAGTERTLYAGTPLIFAMQSVKKATVEILYMGTNGGFSDADDLVSQYKAMVESLDTKNYLIIGLHHYWGYSTGSQFAALEVKMEKAFSNKYLNVRKYAIGNAITDGGLTATEADIAAIENGMCPPQLLTDGTHWTSLGYELLGTQIYNRGKVLGYW